MQGHLWVRPPGRSRGTGHLWVRGHKDAGPSVGQAICKVGGMGHLWVRGQKAGEVAEVTQAW